MENQPILKLFMLIILLISVAACDDNADSQRTIIIAGDPTGAFFYSDLPEPDTMINDNIHMTAREFDLDNDGKMDISIIAEMDTVYNGGLATRATKKLSMRAVDPGDNAVILSTAEELSRIYGKGQAINRNNSFWTPVIADPLLLAGSDQDLSNGQSEITGNWNGRDRQFLGFLLPRETEILVWFELSVLNVDNYVYFNHAAFYLD